MPTLQGIQGSSLQPRVDVIENLVEGSQAAETLRGIRNRKGVDETIKDMATGSATGAQVTQGAGGQPQGAGGPAMPPAGQQGGSGALQRAIQTGQVDPNAPRFNPVQQLGKWQQELLKHGAEGAVAAEALGTLRDQAQARIDAAINKELQSVAQVATALRSDNLSFEDQTAIIQDLGRSAKGDPRMLKMVQDLLGAQTKEQRDFYLQAAENKALTALQAREAKAMEGEIGVEQAKLPIRQQEADTAALAAATKWQDVQQKIQEWKAEPGRAGVDAKRELAQEITSTATTDLSTATDVLTVLDQTDETLADIAKIETGMASGSVPMGVVGNVSEKLSKLYPELGDAAAAFTGSPTKENLQRLRAMYNTALIKRLEQMERPSDRDLAVAIDAAANSMTSDTATARQLLKDQRQVVTRKAGKLVDIVNQSKSAFSGEAKEADLDKLIDLTTEHTRYQLDRDNIIAEAKAAVASGADKDAVGKRLLDTYGINPLVLDL